MDSIIGRIAEWNIKRGLISKGFNHELESAFIIEEVLESFGFEKPKDISREYVKALKSRSVIAINGVTCDKTHEPTLGQKLDAWIDIFVYNVGGLFKLSPSPVEGINRVMDHNDAKGSTTDSEGKIMKTETFVEPTLDDLVYD